MNTLNDKTWNGADEADEAQQRGRERNRGNDEQLEETVEQFGDAIDANVYRKLERLTREEKRQPVIHTKRSERRW